MRPPQSKICPPAEGPAPGVRHSDNELVHAFRCVTAAKLFPRWIAWHFSPPSNPASSNSSASGPGKQRRCNGPVSAARGVHSTPSPVPLRWTERRISGGGGRVTVASRAGAASRMPTATFPPFSGPGCTLGCSPRGLNPRSNRSAGLWGRFRGGAGRSSIPGMLRASGLRSASAAAWRSSFRIRSGTSPGSSRTPRTNTQMRRLRPSQSMQACLHQPTSACSQAVSNRMPAPGCRPLRRGVPQAGRPVASPMNAAEIPASGYCCNQRRLAPVALSHCRLTRSSMEQPLGHGLWKVPRGHICVDTNPIPGPNAGTGWRREDLRPS